MEGKDISENILADKQAEILHKMIEMVTRQTEYSYDDAKEHLILNNWDYSQVIKDYMGVTKKEKPKKTLNQEIFGQIRKKMDEAASKVYMPK